MVCGGRRGISSLRIIINATERICYMSLRKVRENRRESRKERSIYTLLT